MNTTEIGKRLIELATSDNDAQALEELYSDNIVSVEVNTPDGDQPGTWEGIAAVKEKHAWWNSMTTMHEVTAEGPFAGTGDDQFVVKFCMDVTMAEEGRSKMTEVGVFTVSDGQIVREVYLPLVTE